MHREIGRYRCTDIFGTVYEVAEILHFARSEIVDGKVSEMPLDKKYRLSTGGAVDLIDDTTFEIVASGTRVSISSKISGLR